MPYGQNAPKHLFHDYLLTLFEEERKPNGHLRLYE